MEYTKTLESSSIEKDIEYEFVRLLLKNELFCTTYIEYLTPNIFRDSLRPIVESCISYWKKYGKLITNEALVQSIQFKIGIGLNKEKVQSILEVISEISKDVTIIEYSEDILKEFITAQKVENSLIACAELYKKFIKNREIKHLTKIPEIITEACQPIILSKPTRLFADLPIRTEERGRIASGEIVKKFIPTNIPFVDRLTISGGFEPGQLCMWTASTGGGKTIALSHNAYAANLYGYNCVFFTLELTDQQIMDRMDSMISGVDFNKIGIDSYIVQAKINETINDNQLSPTFGETIIVDLSTGGASVQTLRNELIKLQRNFGFKADLIVVDYLDILSSSKRTKVEEWKRQQDVARELRELGNQMGCVVWTASQANRGAVSKVEEDGVIGEDNIAESYAKQTVADFIASINRKKTEGFDPKPMKLHVVKNRLGPAGSTKEILTAYSRMSFYEGESEPKVNSLESGAFK